MNDLSHSSCPLAPVDRRLCDGLDLLLETKEHYFEPDHFRISLNNTIQTLRNVTFVLQKNKSISSAFDAWYSIWQEKMRADELMKWLVTVRNIIVKQGDLKTYSLARISILESWFEQPKFEMQVDPFTRTEDLARLLSERVPKEISWDVGLLRVERRWVHDQLQEHDILDCLAHSFGILGELLIDAHNVLLNELTREQCSWFRMLKRSEGRLPPCMVAQDWDRTVWIDMRDGSVITPVTIPIKQSEEDLQKAAERYPWLKNLKRKRFESYSLEDEAAFLFQQAKKILQKDGYHLPVAFLGYPDGTRRITGLQIDDRTGKHLLMRKLAVEIEKTGAVSLILINEAWLSRGRKLPISGHAVDDPNREEVLQLIASNARGQLFVHTAVFVRDTEDKVFFTEEGRITIDALNILKPIRDAWSRMK